MADTLGCQHGLLLCDLHLVTALLWELGSSPAMRGCIQCSSIQATLASNRSPPAAWGAHKGQGTFQRCCMPLFQRPRQATAQGTISHLSVSYRPLTPSHPFLLQAALAGGYSYISQIRKLRPYVVQGILNCAFQGILGVLQRTRWYATTWSHKAGGQCKRACTHPT